MFVTIGRQGRMHTSTGHRTERFRMRTLSTLLGATKVKIFAEPKRADAQKRPILLKRKRGHLKRA